MYPHRAANVPSPLANCPHGRQQPVLSPRLRFLGGSCPPVAGAHAPHLVLPHARPPHALFPRLEGTAPVAPATAAPLGASTRARSIPPPSPVSTVAPPGPSRRGWLRHRAGAAARWRGATPRCGLAGTTSSAPAPPSPRAPLVRGMLPSVHAALPGRVTRKGFFLSAPHPSASRCPPRLTPLPCVSAR